jgi:hypothetical protein
LHPSYLDSKGLLACWREALLAKKVLQNKTNAYKHHPQLIRFKQQSDKINCIKSYLYELYKEAKCRNYNFDFDKICNRNNANFFKTNMTITDKQLEYEMKHLQKKLMKRDLKQYTANLYNVYDKNMNPENLNANQIFKVIEGEIEDWEKLT